MLRSVRLTIIRALGAVPVEDVSTVVNTAVAALHKPAPYTPPRLQGAPVPPSFPSLDTARADAEILVAASRAGELTAALSSALGKKA